MRLFDILISLSATFSGFNHRFLTMPTAIGLMPIALLLSLFLLLPLPFSDGLVRANARRAEIEIERTELRNLMAEDASGVEREAKLP